MALDIALVEHKRRQPISEHTGELYDYTQCGVPPAEFMNGTTGTHARWAGMRQGRVSTPHAPSVREAEAREARARAFEGTRREHIDRCVNRNAFNPVTGVQASVSRDTFKPRALGSPPGKTDFISWEGNKRMNEGGARFFKVPAEEWLDRHGAQLQTRARVILNSGLESTSGVRTSSVVGYGRKERVSAGAADAFGASGYGGLTLTHPDRTLCETAAWRLRLAAGEPDERHTTTEVFQGTVPRDVWDVGVMAHDPEAAARRLAATSRAPNRVFDTTSSPVTLVTLPDPVLRGMREERELRAHRPARPVDRPASFTAHATVAEARRTLGAKQSEVDMVARLHM